MSRILVRTFGIDSVRVMIFVDGENFAIRAKVVAEAQGREFKNPAVYQPDVFLWVPAFNQPGPVGVVRKFYYTSVQSDAPALADVEDRFKNAGIEAPRVFKKAKGSRSKRVDISLATDMLLHATRRHYDAVLVAGDEDYVPLVEAVQAEGRRVHLWFFENGLSPVLKRAVDHFVNIQSDVLAHSELKP
jgi:uncharacterized LabA/DUF88 family protein